MISLFLNGDNSVRLVDPLVPGVEFTERQYKQLSIVIREGIRRQAQHYKSTRQVDDTILFKTLHEAGVDGIDSKITRLHLVACVVEHGV